MFGYLHITSTFTTLHYNECKEKIPNLLPLFTLIV
jgi:hypothetical protein